jgi:hypothetical protein
MNISSDLPSAIGNLGPSPLESPTGTKTIVATEAIAAVSSTVKGERYTSTVNKSENGYDATVPVAPPITVHGDSPQQVEKAISQMVDYYA